MYCSDVSFKYDHTFHSHTERSGDLTLALNAPPHTPRNYTFTCTEIVAVHIGIDFMTWTS